MDGLIEVRRAREYAAAVSLLEDLRFVAMREDDLGGLAERMGLLRAKHMRLFSLISRFDAAEFP